MDGIFITGIDTGVGKTTVCAGLLKALVGTRKTRYWKPIQTGTLLGDDTKEVRAVTGLSDDYFIEPCYRFAEPASPWVAAKQWGSEIDVDVIQKTYEQYKKAGDFLIVEGAGGILVPITDKILLIHIIKQFDMPVVIVGHNRLGTINQNLLTINACRAENIPMLGVILTKTRTALNKGNAEAIEKFGKVPVLAQFDETEDRAKMLSEVSCHPQLRQILGLPPLP